MVLLFMALALFVLWIIGLGIKAAAWLTWLVFVIGVILLISYFIGRAMGTGERHVGV
jgi:hypothetical protein